MFSFFLFSFFGFSVPNCRGVARDGRDTWTKHIILILFSLLTTLMTCFRFFPKKKWRCGGVLEILILFGYDSRRRLKRGPSQYKQAEARIYPMPPVPWYARGLSRRCGTRLAHVNGMRSAVGGLWHGIVLGRPGSSHLLYLLPN